LKGSIGGSKLIPAVIGDIVEVGGEQQNGVCENIKQIHVAQIPSENVLKDDVKIDITPRQDTYLDDVIQKDAGLNGGYLAFTTEMAQKDRAEVLIQDIASEEVINIDNQKDTARYNAMKAKPLEPWMCGRYWIKAATVTNVAYRVYSEKSGSAKILAVLNIGGTRYNAMTKMRNSFIVSLSLSPLLVKSPANAPPPKQIDLSKVKFM